MSGASLAGQHVLVTGGGTGIGAAIAAALAAEGASISLAGRRREPLQLVAATLPKAQVIDGFDVTDPAKIAAGLAKAHAGFGPVDILVNNAGEAPSAPFDKLTLDEWNRVLAVNATSVFMVTQAVLPDMRAKKSGRIITIASTAGLVGYPYVTAYVAAKHAIVGLTRALALELARTGITVNAVCPGFTDTPLIERAVETIVSKTQRDAGEAKAALAKSNPQGRLVQPDEVAHAVLWLASAGATSITGQAIAVSGGEVMTG